MCNAWATSAHPTLPREYFCKKQKRAVYRQPEQEQIRTTPLSVGGAFMPTRFRLLVNAECVGNKHPPYLGQPFFPTRSSRTPRNGAQASPACGENTSPPPSCRAVKNGLPPGSLHKQSMSPSVRQKPDMPAKLFGGAVSAVQSHLKRQVLPMRYSTRRCWAFA